MGQQFSPGLLYSVAPENFSELHLQDEERVDAFEWETQKSTIESFLQTLLSLIKNTATR